MGTPSDVAPILWQHGAFARLDKGEKIDKLLYNGYSTISLGYAGLYECVKYMTGHSHTDGDIGEKFGLEVMQALTDKCNQWKEAENIDYSPYGSPIESTTYKFAKCLKKRFGVIEVSLIRIILPTLIMLMLLNTSMRLASLLSSLSSRSFLRAVPLAMLRCQI